MDSSLDAASLVERHQRGIWCYLRALGCDASTADDLCQETFLAILRRPFDDYDRAATAAYLRKVARNRFLMAVRARRARPRLVSLDGVEPVFETLMGDGNATLTALRRCLERLPERTRAVVEARFQAGEKSKAVAAALGIKEALVNTIVARGKVLLRDCIKERLADERR